MPSTVIRSFSYHARRRELEIVFQTTRSYTYFGVAPEIHAAMGSAPSKGVFFNRHIRGRYPFRRNADVPSVASSLPARSKSRANA